MTVYNLFLEQIQKNANSIAIEYGNKKLTYAQLGTEVNHMASYLKNCGVKKGDIVGISLNRSIEMIISLLGIIKVGAIYLPLDPAFPPNRIQFMLEDSKCSYLITENSIAESFGYYKGKVINVSEYKRDDVDNTEEEITEESIVYILYTSGSTGNPKGVQIKHKSLVNFLLSMKETPGMSSQDSLLAVTTLSFDISGLEIYLPLITGSKVVIASKEETVDGRLLVEKLKNVTVMQATPSTWKMLLESGWSEKLKLKALCGGEPLSRDLANKILEKVDELWNMYGPTETTIWSSCSKVEKGNGIIHLGEPIANTQFYIVDKNNQFCAPGVAGELLIGGEGLSIGYLNKDELTKEKFIPNPFDKERKTKVYRTGDLVKLNSKMQIEFLGRIDNQVKIRGFRIELGEIESAIKKNDFVRDCVAVVKEFAGEDKRIIAFYTINQIVEFEEKDTDSIEHVEKWRDNYDKIYENAINNLSRKDNDSLEIGYLVVEQFEQEKSYKDQFNVWINETTKRIKKLEPDRVLEVGCGGGDILKRIISECSFYCATDLSPKVIEHLENDLKSLDQKMSEVKLFALPADADLPIEKNHFDTIIMNSVAVYFPNEKYLTDVVSKLTDYLSDTGCFFIGDMQSYSLQKNLYLFEQLRQISDDMKIKEFSQILSSKIRTAPEFFIDPIYFYNLVSTNSKIKRIEIKLMRGSLENDPSTYHYDVFINPDLHKKISDNVKTLQWNSEIQGVEKISYILNEEMPEIIYIKDIPNSRIENRMKIQNAIENTNSDNLVLDVVNSIKLSDYAINPEDIWNLENEVEYSIDLILPENGDQIHFDAVLISKRVESNMTYPIRKIEKSDNTKIKYCNEPVSTFSYDHLNTKIKENILAILPDYMRPASYVPLQSFPMTPNNKIDRNALINYNINESNLSKDILLPGTPTEIILYEIWKKLLGLKSLSIEDNFFELGGHSILAVQMFTELEKETGRKLPLASLFKAQTIKELSKLITDENFEKIWSPLIEIKQGLEKHPLFLVHGAEGNILLYRELAEYITSDKPIYGLQSRGLNGKENLSETIEEMAADYINAIREVQPNGPYSIGGYCMGGTVAYEMARRLEKEGEEISKLILLETYNVSIIPNIETLRNNAKLQLENIGFHLDNLLSLNGVDRIDFLKQKFATAVRRIKVRMDNILAKFKDNSEKELDNNPDNISQVRKSNDLAQLYYKPGKFNGRTILIRPRKSFSLESDPNFGWDKLVDGEFKVYNLNLSPRGMLAEPFVKETATIITKEIRAK